MKMASEVGPLGHCRRVYCRHVVVWWLYSNFKKFHSNLGTRYLQYDTCNLNRVRNGGAMETKPGTIVLIMKIASEVGPLSSCCCMKFLTSNDFGGGGSANPESLTVVYLIKRTWVYKSTAYRRERASGKTLGGPQVYKYPIAVKLGYQFKFSSFRRRPPRKITSAIILG